MAAQGSNSRPGISHYFEPDGIHTSRTAIGSERHLARAESDSAAIVVRNLPRSTSHETLQSMFLCAKDFLGADFLPEMDHASSRSAIARFHSINAAEQAKANLDGKPNASDGSPIVADIWESSPGNGPLTRRNTFDLGMMRNGTSSISSSASSNGINGRHPSRYNSNYGPSSAIPTFANESHMLAHGATSDLSSPEYNQAYRSASHASPNGPRVSGKAMIGEEGDDEEQTAILNESLAYAQNEYPASSTRASHRPSMPQFPTSAFSNLSLNSSSVTTPPPSDFPSSRSTMSMQSPNGIYPSSSGSGPTMPFHMMNQQYPRNNFPPVNPADQNPPCNTLYVGNLPVDTSEEELKTIFSKQRGYKRLCFRTKQNGPMCFVEFEDISMATRALNDLYGHMLHNSVKGGIRLSFSKNPLGVRAGQNPHGHMTGSQVPLVPQCPMPSMSGMTTVPPFNTAHGPPPGLAAPPGLNHQPGPNGATGMSDLSPMGGIHAMGSMNDSMGQYNAAIMAPGYGMPMQGYIQTMRPQGNHVQTNPQSGSNLGASSYEQRWSSGVLPNTGFH